jgi:hypothetical protein
MDITDAIVLSRKKSTKFLGEVFAYQSNEEVVVEGIVSSLNFSPSSNPTEESITVNGQDLGTGIVKSISMSAKNQAGLDMRKRVTFEVFKQGSTASLGAEYPSIPAANFKYIKSFSESSSCDVSQDVQSYTHSVNVKLTIYNGTGLSTAKSIAATFLDSNALVTSTSVNANKYNTPPGKSFFDETYDEVNSECSFSKKYEIATNADSTTGYILFRSSSINYDSNGVATATENADYQDISGNGPPTTAANTDITGALDRCSGLLSTLTSASSNVGTMSLITTPISKGMTVDKDSRKVTYHVTFSTNLKIDSTKKIYSEYTTTIETTNAGIKYETIEGNIVGMGEIDTAEDESSKYKNAQIEWKNIANGTFPNGVTLNGKPFSFSTNHDQLKGTISYTIKYSDCASIIYPEQGKVRRVIHKNSTEPVNRNLAQVFKVINHDEILQQARHGNLLQKMRTESTSINGNSIAQMKDLVPSIINASPQGSNYGQSATLSFNSSSRQLTATINIIEIP